MRIKPPTGFSKAVYPRPFVLSFLPTSNCGALTLSRISSVLRVPPLLRLPPLSHRDTHTDRDTEIHTETHIQRHTHTKAQAQRYTHRDTHTETHIYRDTHRERHAHTETHVCCKFPRLGGLAVVDGCWRLSLALVARPPVALRFAANSLSEGVLRLR